MPHFLSTSLVAAVLLVVSIRPAAAQPNTCVAGKLACANAFVSAVFKCYATIFKKGFGGANQDTGEECVRNARRKFGTAVTSKVPCWDKVEAKEKPAKPATVCPAMIADEFDVDALVEAFTLDIAENEIAPGGPVPFGSTCSSGKVHCVAAFFKQRFKCEINAAKDGAPVAQACVAKALAKFGGGTDPAKGCFAKLEAKQKLGKLKTLCDAVGNAAVAGGKAMAFVDDVVGALTP